MSIKSKLVKPENTLKKKVGNGGFNEKDLIKAQEGIEKNDIDFRPMAKDLIAELDVVVAQIKDGSMPVPEQLGNIMYPMMQLKSQGTLFRYPLVTKISHTMLDFLESIDEPNKDVMVITDAYKNSVNAMLALQIKDPAHKAGNQLIEELQKAFARYTSTRQKA